MRFGVCCSLEQAPIALAAGADYIEAAGGRIGTDPEYRQSLAGLPVEASNLFFPGGMALYEQEEEAVAHGHEVLRHGAHLGVRVAVIGSGAARRSSGAVSREAANLRFVEIVARIAAKSQDLSLPVAPESLQREETDVGNDLGTLAHALRNVGVGYTADSFHILKEWDYEGREVGRPFPSDSYLEDQLPFLPLHVHFAPLSRKAPTSGDPMLQAFVTRLRALDYRGRVSLECGWDDFGVEIGPALEATRRLWA